MNASAELARASIRQPFRPPSSIPSAGSPDLLLLSPAGPRSPVRPVSRPPAPPFGPPERVRSSIATLHVMRRPPARRNRCVDRLRHHICRPAAKARRRSQHATAEADINYYLESPSVFYGCRQQKIDTRNNHYGLLSRVRPWNLPLSRVRRSAVSE